MMMTAPERIINYLLDIVSAPSGTLPSRTGGYHDELIRAALQLRIFHPVATWILDSWPEILPESTQNSLRNELDLNIARNAALSIQITKLSGLFVDHKINCMFIKGAAAHVREIFPSGWRFMSDIDIVVPEHQISDSFYLLRRENYREIPDAIIQAHHIQPLSHPDFAGTIELHTNLYQKTPDSRSIVSEVLSDAERIEFKNFPVTVPSITDHVWIMMRTDPISRPLLPRLCDVIELDFIGRVGYDIDFERLNERSREDGMPALVSGMSFACGKYGDMKPFAPIDMERLRQWEQWSLELRRRFFKKEMLESSRNRFAALTFLPSKGFRSKLRFFFWLLRLVWYVDRFVPGKAKEPPFFKKIYRFLKLATSYIFAATEYYIFCTTTTLCSFLSKNEIKPSNER